MSSIVVTIDNQSIAFDYILRYLTVFPELKKYRINNYKRCIDGKMKIQLKMGWDEVKINYNNEELLIKYEVVGDPKGTNYGVLYYEQVIIEMFYKDDGKNNAIKVVSKFLEDARYFCDQKEDSWVQTKILQKGYWSLLSNLPKRDISTIYLDDKEDLLNDVNDFLKNEKVYEEYGIPYKRNYLFEGLPGTGKSSLIFAIASNLDRDIYLASFSPTMDDSEFMKAVTSIPGNSILVLEDIDCLFVKRKQNDVAGHSLSFSGILNFLDGIGRRHGLITFMTTNYKNRLDSALIRPGRVDKIITFSSASKTQIEKMFLKFFPDQKDDFERFYEKIKLKEITISMLQEYFFNIRGKKVIDNIDLLLNKIKEKNKIPKEIMHLYN